MKLHFETMESLECDHIFTKLSNNLHFKHYLNTKLVSRMHENCFNNLEVIRGVQFLQNCTFLIKHFIFT